MFSCLLAFLNSVSHLCVLSVCLYIKVLIITISLYDRAVILKFKSCQNPLSFHITLRIRLKSPSLARGAPIVMPLTTWPCYTRMHVNTVQAMLKCFQFSKKKKVFVLYASCFCNMLYFLLKLPFATWPLFCLANSRSLSKSLKSYLPCEEAAFDLLA